MTKTKREFKKSDLKFSNKDFDKAIQALVDKGLVEQISVDGETHYKLTNLGLQIRTHVNSDPDQRN